VLLPRVAGQERGPGKCRPMHAGRKTDRNFNSKSGSRLLNRSQKIRVNSPGGGGGEGVKSCRLNCQKEQKIALRGWLEAVPDRQPQGPKKVWNLQGWDVVKST